MKAVFTACSVLSLGIAMYSGAAAAQEASEASQAESAAAPGADEIVVTANRRSESLASVPAAITAVSGQKLISEGVTSAKDIPNIIPNVQVGVAGFAIRGVASADFTDKGDPSTAFHVNGIYIGRFPEQQLAMFDVARVEVLRGPQGTLYGRNATAGVLNVVAERPGDTFSAQGTADYGNYNSVRLNAAVNAPLSDAVSMRVAAVYNRNDGYTPTRDGNGRLDNLNDFGVRASLLFKLSDAVKLYVAGDYVQSKTNGVASIAAARALVQNDDSSQRFQNPGFKPFSQYKAGGVTAELTADLGIAELTYLFGYREARQRDRMARNDIPLIAPGAFSNGDFANSMNSNQQSHELRLASNGDGPLKWIVGAYYFRENPKVAPYLLFPAFGFALDYDIDTVSKSFAGFGQLTYEISPGLRLTGGLRYTDDKKDRKGLQTFLIPGTPVAFPTVFDGSYPGGGISGNKVTWKAGAEVDLATDVLAFANVTTGYKAGGFNDGSPADVSPVPFYYKPETITSYEGGIKGTVLDRSLYFSLVGFVYDYNDLQLGLVKTTGGQVTQNIPSASIKGLEFDGWLRLGAGTKIDYSLAYLDAKYNDFFPLQGNTAINFRGTPLDRSPKWTGRVALTQDYDLANGGRISGTAALKFSSSYVVTDGNTATQIVQDKYTRTDLTLGYFAPGDAWFIQAYGRNLEDNRLLGLFELGAFTLTSPREYGVRAGFKF